MKRNLLQQTFLCLCFTFICLIGYAQNGTLQGKVSDEGGNPAVGVNVVVAGTTRGTAVKSDGTYSLTIPAGVVKIQFSGIGYKTIIQDVTISSGQSTTLDVSMTEGDEILNSIVVTATRQPIRKIETTTAVDVLDSRNLAKQQPSSISETVRQVPGVFVENYTGRIRTNIMMRGFPDGTVNSVKYSQLLVDGLPAYASPAEPVDAYIKFDKNIERIEVVRGSAATLFGKSTAAGVVNVITKAGGEKLGGLAQITLGSNPTASQSGLMSQFDLNLNGPITKNLRFNIGGFYLQDPGYRDSGFPDKGYQARANLDYLLGENGSKGSIRVYGGLIDLNVMNHVYIPYKLSDLKPYPGYTNASTVWGASQNNVTYSQISNVSGQAEIKNLSDNLEMGNRTEGYHAGLRAIFNLGTWTITEHFRTQEAELGNNFNISTRFNAPTAAVPAITGDLFQFVGNTANEDIINEFQIRNQYYTGSVKHSFAAGFYYSKNINRPRGQAFVSNPYNIDPFTNGMGQAIERNTFLNTANGTAPTSILAVVPVFRREESRNSAIFFGDELSINDKFRIDFGLRYDWNQLIIDVYDVLGSSPGPGLPPIFSPYLFTTNVNTTRTVALPQYTAFSGSLGANYLLNENSAFYINLVRAFRLPDEDTFTGAVPVPEEERGNLKETITNVELGYRGAVANADLNFAITGFYTDIQDLLNSIFNATTVTFEPRREGSIRILGTELSLIYTPSAVKGLLVNANLTLQSSKYTDFTNFRNPGDMVDVDVTGNRVQRIPSLLWNLGASYDRKFFGVNFNMNYIGGERYFEPANLLKMREIINATAGIYGKYDIQGAGTIRLGVNVTNAFNTDAPVILASADIANALRGTKDGGAGLIAGTPTLPRRVFFNLSYAF